MLRHQDNINVLVAKLFMRNYLNGHNAKSNVVVASLRLEPLPERGPIGPTIVGPGAAPPRARYAAIPKKPTRPGPVSIPI